MAMVTTSKDTWPADVPIRNLKLAGLPKECKVRLKLFTLDNQLILKATNAGDARRPEVFLRAPGDLTPGFRRIDQAGIVEYTRHEMREDAQFQGDARRLHSRQALLARAGGGRGVSQWAASRADRRQVSLGVRPHGSPRRFGFAGGDD